MAYTLLVSEWGDKQKVSPTILDTLNRLTTNSNDPEEQAYVYSLESLLGEIEE